MNIKWTAIVFFPVLLIAQEYEFSFAVIADPQFGLSYSADTTYCGRAIRAINSGHNSNKASFTLVLGDLSNGAYNDVNARTRDIKINFLDKLDSAYYVIAGNHDYYDIANPDSCAGYGLDSLVAIFGNYPQSGLSGSDSVWSFSRDSWAFFGLTGSCMDQHGVLPHVNIDSLTAEVKDAAYSGKYKIICSHHGILNIPGKQDWNGADTYSNYAALRDSILAWADVKIVMNGHRHYKWQRLSNYGGSHTLWLEVVARPYNSYLWFDCYSDGSFRRTIERISGAYYQ